MSRNNAVYKFSINYRFKDIPLIMSLTLTFPVAFLSEREKNKDITNTA